MTQLFATRLLIPRRRRGVVARRRLLDRLHEHLDRRLTLIVAPAGYGKTTLVADFVNEVGWPCAWYTVDVADADPRVFLSYVVTALERTLPRFGPRSRELVEGAPGRSIDVPSVIAEIVSSIHSAAEQPFCFVIDDVAAVATEPEIGKALDLLIANLPVACHLILLSRTSLKLRLISQLAQRNVLGLGKADLRFTEREVVELLEHEGLPTEGASELASITDGWVTGVLLSAPAFSRAGTISGVTRPAHEFLAAEVILRIPPETREFAQRAALFTTFDAASYEEVFGPFRATLHIQVLEEVSPFIERLDGEGRWYRFTQLFRSALLEMFETNQPVAYRQAAERVGRWAAERKDWDVALKLLRVAADAEAVAHLLDDLAPKEFEAGNLQRLRGWLDELPNDVLDAHPKLAVLRARIALYLDTRHDAQLRAERALRLGGLDPESEIRAHLVRANALWLTGFPGEALAVAQQALPIAEALGSLTLRAEVQRHQGVILLQMGRLREALGLLLEAREHLPQDDFAIAQVEENLGIVWAKFGEIGAARRCFHMAVRIWEKLGNRTQICNALNSLGVRAQELGNFDEAHHYLDQAMRQAEESNNRRLIGLVNESLGDLLFAEGRHADGERRYKRALREARALDERAVICSALEGLGQIAMSRDDLEASDRYLRAGEALALDAPQLEAGQQLDLAIARLDLRRGYPVDACTRVAGVVQQLEAQGKAVLLARARFWLAAAYAAISRLSQANEVWSLSDPKIRLAAEFMLDAVQREELGRLLAPALGDHLWTSVRAPSGRSARRATTSSARSLEVRTLGPIEVRLDGKAILLTSERMLDHLIYLAVQPSGVRAEAMVEDLWPDAPLERRFASLQQTIYRLRRYLGEGSITFERGHYRLGRSLSVTLDVELLEREINTMLSLQVDDASLMAHGQRAELLYRGPYLEALDGAWCNIRRDRLAGSYLAAMCKVAEHYLLHARARDAAALLSRLSELDPLNEPLFAMLVSALVRAGDAIAAQHYGRRFVEQYEREFGAAPSPGFLKLLDPLH